MRMDEIEKFAKGNIISGPRYLDKTKESDNFIAVPKHDFMCYESLSDDTFAYVILV